MHFVDLLVRIEQVILPFPLEGFDIFISDHSDPETLDFDIVPSRPDDLNESIVIVH